MYPRILFVAALLGGCLNAHAQQRSAGPPEVAIKACQGISAEDRCQFISRRGDSLSGQCRQVPDDVLACVPEGFRPPRRAAKGEQQ